MSGQYLYEKRYKYPHLKPLDVAIWERFISARPDFWETVDYDLAIGTGAPIAPGTEENMARDKKILTQYKIDVVGYRGNAVDIVELKPNAGASAIGQVKSYETLYKNYINPDAKTRAIIITDTARADVALLAYKMGVVIYIV